jgi:hypothetical protein
MMIEPGAYKQADHTAPLMSDRAVLDLHADLQRYLARQDPLMRSMFTAYAIEDLIAGHSAWAASHLHPARRVDDLGPWLDSLGRDLFGATTYKITAEMIDLAEGLSVNTPDLADLMAEDVPSPEGFMWFDRPIPRPSVEDKGEPPMVMHALSWAMVPRMDVAVGPGGPVARVPAIRIREWGWNDDPVHTPRPLHLMGQSCTPLTQHVHTPLTELHLVKMIWILMQMEIVSTAPIRQADRAAVRRAANLKHKSVRVVMLRRQVRKPSDREPARRPVDWTCTWLVRGHHRHEHRQDHRAVGPIRHGGPCLECGDATSYIAPYIKGPDGLPLRASDLLVKLAR